MTENNENVGSEPSETKPPETDKPGGEEIGPPEALKKTLHNSDASGTRKNVPDVQIVGDGDLFQLLCKASSQKEGWMKSTKAMQVPGGCVVQVTTQQKNMDHSYSVAEALTFVAGVKVAADDNGGRKLVSNNT